MPVYTTAPVPNPIMAAALRECLSSAYSRQDSKDGACPKQTLPPKPIAELRSREESDIEEASEITGDLTF